MTGLSEVLARLWLGLLAHLWQTSVVVVPLVVLGLLLKTGPHRLTSAAAWLGLAKLLLPLSLLAPLLARVLAPFAGRAADVRVASEFLNPTVLVTSADSAAPLSTWLLPSLTAAWAAGAVWFAVRLWRRRPAALLRRSLPVRSLEPAVRCRLDAALEATGIEAADIRIVPGRTVPCVLGLRRRSIMLPVDVITLLPQEELRGVLLHEQEHARRGDPLREMVLGIINVVFYFYPPLWLVSGWLRRSAEFACDEAAVRAGVRPEVFSRAVARTLSLGLSLASGPAVLAKRSSSLRDRFSRLDEPWRYAAMTRHRILFALSAACAVLLSAGVVLFAQAPAKTFDVDADTPPELIQSSYVAPVYPEDAKKAGIECEVTLDVLVMPDGSVGRAELAEGTEAPAEFGASALEAVQQWKFVPAAKDGKPIQIWVRIPLKYALDDKKKAEAAPAESGKNPKEQKTTLTTSEPVAITTVAPRYPEDAKKAGVGGRILLRVEVSEDGTVGNVIVEEGVEGYPSLGESATEAISQWRFAPGTRDGKPAKTSVLIPIEFRLDDKPSTKD